MSVVNLVLPSLLFLLLSFWTMPFVLYLVSLVDCIGGDCVKVIGWW
jgi:hypothetical protein